MTVFVLGGCVWALHLQPPERGWGCVTSAHICLNQKQSLTFDRYFLAPLNATKTFEEYICLSRTSYRHTPLSPLSRGEYQYTIKYSFSNKKNSISTSPLEKDRGCVTPRHSCLKPKAVTQSRQTPTPQQQQKYLHLCRPPHRYTPLSPLSRGEFHNTP